MTPVRVRVQAKKGKGEEDADKWPRSASETERGGCGLAGPWGKEKKIGPRQEGKRGRAGPSPAGWAERGARENGPRRGGEGKELGLLGPE